MKISIRLFIGWILVVVIGGDFLFYQNDGFNTSKPNTDDNVNNLINDIADVTVKFNIVIISGEESPYLNTNNEITEDNEPEL